MFPLSGSSWQSLIFMVVFFLVIHVAKSQLLYRHTHSQTPTLFAVQICADEKPSGNIFLSQSIDLLSNGIYWWICSMPYEFLSATSNANDSLNFFFSSYFLLILTVNPVPVETTHWTHRQRRKRTFTRKFFCSLWTPEFRWMHENFG